jgi:hypothetical protein
MERPSDDRWHGVCSYLAYSITHRHAMGETFWSVRGEMMFLKTWRCITIVLAALALTMESAHVLELP